MKYKILTFVLLYSLIFFTTKAQDKQESVFNKFGFEIGAQFHSIALPFSDLKSNFSNPGISAAYEIALNKNKNLIFQTNSSFIFNKNLGNNFQLYPEIIFRPHFFKVMFTELKLGIGWQINFNPANTYEFNNGQWTKTSSSKSQLIVPIGASVGFETKIFNKNISPFVSYQTIPALFYDATIPLNFYSVINIGFIHHFN
jgi:hypothetical protein